MAGGAGGVLTRQPGIFGDLKAALPELDWTELDGWPVGRPFHADSPFELVFADIGVLREAGEGDVTAGVERVRTAYPGARLVVLAPAEELRDAIAAVRGGAANYLTLPLVPEEVRFVHDSLRQESLVEGELDHLRDRFWKPGTEDLLRTNSPRMRAVFNAVRHVAPTKVTVLLRGETGTGKNLLARLIHLHSRRSGGPFIQVHCGAIPESLLESELFGHERGAFTGAVRRKLGRFEIANGGTIFLDEIGTMPLAMQAKLLRVLQDGAFERVGGEATVPVDVRVVAATNEDLEAACAEGRFRKDLFYRLNVFPVEIPPLRERIEDLELIVTNVLDRLEVEYGKRIFGVEDDVMEAFRSYPWPGNVRELESLLERAYVVESGRTLSRASFPSDIFFFASPDPGRDGSQPLATLAEIRALALEKAEVSYLRLLMKEYGGSTTRAAQAAGVTPRQLRNLLRRRGVTAAEFRPKR